MAGRTTITIGTQVWVSPTGRTVMLRMPDGSVTYEFPDTPVKQPARRPQATKTAVGLSALAAAV